MIPVGPVSPDCRVVAFQPWHLLALDLRPLDRVALGPFQVEDLAQVYAARGFAFTGLWRGRPVACFGAVPFWPGVAQAWAATGSDVHAIAKTFHAEALRQVAGLMRGLGLRRLETTVLEEHAMARRWIERLGFTCEGVRRRFGPGGHDFLMYARLGDG